MNVEENTAFYLNQHGDPETGKRLSREEIADRVMHALELVGLQETQKKMLAEMLAKVTGKFGVI